MNEAAVIIAKLLEDNFWSLYLTVNFWIVLAFIFGITCAGAVMRNREQEGRES